MTRLASLIAIIILTTITACTAGEIKMDIKPAAGQAELGTVEIIGVSAGEFQPKLWEAGTLNFQPDVRRPLIEPRKRGVFRNIYAPSVVELEDGWRVFYGAWDGVESGNDRIYSVFTRDFLDFSDRQIVIEHGDFVHVCNVNALRLPDGSYRLMCTAYPDNDGLNKPATFTSADGQSWNGSPAPYVAKKSDIITINGYDKFATADINGMNVILFEDGVYRLYFNNFKDFGKVYRATSKDGKTYSFDGVSVEFGACVNDVKKFVQGNTSYYLMGLHMNGDTMWYSLSKDGLKFQPVKTLAKNLDAKDRYMVAHGWVVRDGRVLGFLYGAGEISSLDRNRIWARWLQKKVVFVADDGTRYEPSGALGPDRQIISVPRDKEIKGHFEVYAEDGITRLVEKIPGSLVSGRVYVVESGK